MLTITISARGVLLAALLILAAAAALYATDALGSGDPPDSILQGDTDCDGDVDAQDALNDLRYVGGLNVGPFGACPQIGTEAAIPGPQGEPGPQGPAGPPGVTLWAEVSADGELLAGTAVSAEKNVQEYYLVDFGQDISGCGAVASHGSSTSVPQSVVLSFVWTGVDGDSIVSVGFRDDDAPVAIQTGFFVILAC